MSNKFRSKILLIASLWLSSMVAVTTFTACSDSNDDEPGAVDSQSTGISNPGWDGDVVLAAKGQTYNITFSAAADWTIDNKADWLTLSTTSGKAGNAVVMATAKANDANENRETFLTVRVNGYKQPTTIKVVQAYEEGETPTGVNAWVRNYMESHYLWNEPIPALKISNALTAEQYLDAILKGVDANDHLNREDGHWADGKREYFYSWIEANAARSRAAGEQVTGSGVMYMDATLLDQNNSVGLIVSIVCPGSPAAQAGLYRGVLITAVNGTRINTSNYSTMGEKVYDGNVTITWNKVTFDDEGYGSVEPQGDLKLNRATFNDVSVYMSKILELNNGTKVGYMLYNSFDYGYDTQLINAFTKYKEEGITELILDLRYNPGGHVISSLLMGTLIAGQQHKGEIYGRSVYNATRMQTTSPGEYKLGVATTPEMPNGYDKITEGLATCIGLNRIYVICSENTASASELVINGLRGVGVDVRLIGTTTNGKNCGMEGIEKTFGNYTYSLYPITFYIENAKGFKDYADGFTPDVDFDDSDQYPGDFGTTDDPYTLFALYWIANGTKPSFNTANSRALSSQFGRHLTLNDSPISKRHIKGAMMLPRE